VAIRLVVRKCGRRKCGREGASYPRIIWTAEQSNQCQEKHDEPEGALLKTAKKPTQADILRRFIEQSCKRDGCWDMRLHSCVLPQGADQMKKARLIQPNLIPPALGGRYLQFTSLQEQFLSFNRWVRLECRASLRQEAVILVAEETGAVDAITLKSENARNFM
jgi:hypothetical protein